MSGTRNETECVAIRRDEFQCSSFGLSYHTPKWLASDQWGWRIFYVVWRVFWAAFHLSFLIYDQSTFLADIGSVYYIYLTKWTYILLVYGLIYRAVVVIFITCRPRHFSDGETPWFMKTAWLLYELSSTASLLITLLYFAVVFSGRWSLMSVIEHIVNSVYVLLDVCVTGMPVRLLHCVYVMAYAAVYTIFTVIYWAADGKNHNGQPYVYSALDWNRPGTAAGYAIGLTLIGVPAMHSILWALHLLRRFLYEKYCTSKGVEKDNDEGGEDIKPSNPVTPV